jgi:PAS domain S-box-containing protein
MIKPVVESLPEAIVDLTEEALIRVLHVDDDADFLNTAKQILEMQGSFQVETARSVEEALEKMKKTFDVIVSDYVMPGKNGLDFLKELKDSGCNIPFILFTGKGREEVAIKALNLGADGYFNKFGHPETVYGELAYGIRTTVKSKQAEKELRKSENKYRSLVENVGTGIATTDLEGIFIFVNQALCNMTDYSEKELIGKPFADFLHPDDKERVLQIFLDSWKNPDRKLHIEFRVLHKKGHIVHMYSSPTATMYNNKIIGFNAIISDITERKKAEETLNSMMNQLAMINEKLGVVGSLTRHDVRNKLVAVLNNIYLAKKTLTGNHEALKYLGYVESAFDQVGKIFEFARIYEILGTEELCYVDVSKSVDEAVILFSDLHGAKVVNDCHGLTVLADSLLRQLFYNLIDDSLKYGEKVSQIRMYCEKVGDG